jgi:hypothetical protein
VRQSLKEVDQLWKLLELPQAPKYHALITHALRQAIDIDGFGDMLEDELEKMHQEALRFRSRVTRLRSMAARANAFSASEKVRNNPEVKRAISPAYDATSRTKRKLGQVSTQDERKQAAKTVRVEKRVENLAEEKDVIKREPIKPIEHLKEVFKNEDNDQE